MGGASEPAVESRLTPPRRAPPPRDLPTTWADGSTVCWGTLLTWEPPYRFVMTWGWETLSEAQLSEDCALPGGYTSGADATGWTRILAHFTAAAETADHTA